MQKDTSTQKSTFGKEVHEGLTAYPKYLSSKYFYDETGDQLFQDIMAMPEYYLTNAEYAILDEHKESLASYFGDAKNPFSLYELGAGDGKKTKILLRYFSEKPMDFDYRPIDISQNALESLEQSIHQELPKVVINPIQGTYFETLTTIGQETARKKVILFLGSNIGNLLHPQAIEFLKKLKAVLREGDLIFMGFDQKKHPQTILNAYNDAAGITEAFNKNILTRINRELEGDFKLDKFLHWEVYDPETGTAKSFLVAKEPQQVSIAGLNLKITFDAWETIHTEISQKYDDRVVHWMAKEAGLQVLDQFSDQNKTYQNYLFKRK